VSRAVALFRHPIPRRALWGAGVGLLYSFLILPTAANVVGINPVGVGWFLLSIGLLFLVPLAYHAFTIFGLLSVALDVYGFVKDQSVGHVVDVVIALLAVMLVMTSGYLPAAYAAREADELG
jgi:hypothetical protein